jgi:hypothetical protein
VSDHKIRVYRKKRYLDEEKQKKLVRQILTSLFFEFMSIFYFFNLKKAKTSLKIKFYKIKYLLKLSAPN